jgi:predicted nucleic acid-binding protein
MRVKGIKEIHDRIISATARFYGAGIVTRDRIIKDSGEVTLLE